MKIALVAENYYPSLGGIQEHLYNLRRHLESPRDGSQPVDVRIVTGRLEGVPWRGPPDDGHVLRPAPSFRYPALGSETQMTASPRTYFALRKLWKEERFDLVHLHGPGDFGLPMYTCASWRGPMVATLHSCFRPSRGHYLIRPWYRHVMGRCDAVIAVSPATRDAMGRLADFDAEVIGNGVDCELFASGRPLPHLQGAVNLLTIGRLEHRNGIDLLISAFGLISRERPELRLLVAGDGPLRRDYEEQARALGPAIASRITFLGAVYDERPDLYASASLFVLPARAVGFSILALEALAAGVPLVALRGDGVERAGGHFATATLSDAPTATSLAAAVVTALAGDHPGLRERGREVARRHDWAEVAPRVRRVYERVLAASRRGATHRASAV